MWHLGTQTRILPQTCEREAAAWTPLECFTPKLEAQPLGREQEGVGGLWWPRVPLQLGPAPGRRSAQQHQRPRGFCRSCKAVVVPRARQRARAPRCVRRTPRRTETPRNSPRPAEPPGARLRAFPQRAPTSGFLRHRSFFYPGFGQNTGFWALAHCPNAAHTSRGAGTRASHHGHPHFCWVQGALCMQAQHQCPKI